MKIKAIICAFLCVLLICTTAFATQSAEENTTDNAVGQTEMQPPQEGQMPADENVPQDDAFGGRSFGGRGRPGGGRGMRPGMTMNGESMQPPQEGSQTQTDNSVPTENAENVPAENGEMPQSGFGGRGGFDRGNMGGGNMQMPEQQMQGDVSETAATTAQPNYFTHISAAVLLVLGFLFVIFYKRRTF